MILAKIRIFDNFNEQEDFGFVRKPVPLTLQSFFSNKRISTSIWAKIKSIFSYQKRMFFKLKTLTRLKNRINLEGILQLTVSESRTQLQNKKIATDKILELVEKSLFIPKARKATKPSRSKIEKRIKAKKELSQKKENRKFRGE